MEKNWSISLEHDEYEQNRELVVKDAIYAVERTDTGVYVNLVTPSIFGNPDDYLTPVLMSVFGNKITASFIDQCGCGGYVLRVWKK